jgi:uncharacterized membrane protein
VTAAGTLAALGGACFVAALARLFDWPPAVAVGAAVGGFAGATADSLLGATVQARRWCDRCDAATERLTHGCGTPTRRVGGVPWLDNDAVNAASALAGASIALVVARALAS